MATYGLTVMDHDLPLDPTPKTDTVNIPSMVGGYTYTNVALPAELTLDVLVTAVDNATLHDNIDAIVTALPPLDKLQIHVDGISKYWIGKRISGIQTGLFGGGLTTAEFQIVFSCEDPTAQDGDT